MNKDKTNWGNFPVHIAVEGENFFHFLREKIKSADNLYGNIMLHNYKEKEYEKFGSNPISAWLKLVKTTKNLKSIGLIRDAEYDREATKRSTEQLFQTSFARFPSQSKEINKGLPNLAYLIVPPEGTGCLEHTLLASSVEGAEKNCAVAFANCLAQNGTITNDNHRAKIQVRAMIVAHDPDMWFSHSAQSSLWDWEKPALREILQFLQAMNAFAE